MAIYRLTKVIGWNKGVPLAPFYQSKKSLAQ
jgi:hypothetical protein